MIRITIQGHDVDKVGIDLRDFFRVGQRKIVRHYIVEDPEVIEPIPPCDVALIEIKEKK